MVKTIMVAWLFSIPALAEAPKLDTSDYWKAFAYRHAAGEEFERSLTEQQRQLREQMQKAAGKIAAERAKLTEACKSIGQELDETGQQPTCKASSVK